MRSHKKQSPFPTRWNTAVCDYVDSERLTPHRPITDEALLGYASRVSVFLNWLNRETARHACGRMPSNWAINWTSADAERFLRWRLTSPPRNSGGKPMAGRSRASYSTAKQSLSALVHFSEWLVWAGRRRTNAALNVPPLSKIVNDAAPGRQPPGAEPHDFTLVTPDPERLLKLTGRNVAALYEQDSKMNGLSEKWSVAARSQVTVLMRWMEGEGRTLAQLDRSVIDGYIAHLTSTPSKYGRRRSPNTIKSAFKHGRAFCRWLVRVGVLAADPTEGLRGPRGMRNFVPPLPRGSLGKIVAESANMGEVPLTRARNHALLTMLCSTGLRISEALNLNRADIAAGGTLRIRGKGARERGIDLSERVRTTIRVYLDARWDDNEALFVNLRGERMTPHAAGALCRVLGERAIGRRFSPHDLRRTFFTSLGLQGVAWYTLKAIGGWSTTSAAESYLHAAARELGQAVTGSFDVEAA